MTIGVLGKGDHVLNVSTDFIAVERKNGEVDIIPMLKDGNQFRIDTENIITIGYGDNIIQTKMGDITITSF